MVVGVLTDFIEELRAAGVPVSMVEAIDAARAIEHVDLGDRAAWKATLGATLVKNARHHEAFETAFEVFFGLGVRPGEDDATLAHRDVAVIEGEAGVEGGGSGDVDLQALAEALYRALAEDDDGLLQAVVRQAVRQLSGMEPGRPVGGTYYLYRILRQLDLDEVRSRLLATESAATNPLERRLHTEELDLRLEELRRRLRSEIRRHLVADRGPQAVARTLRRPLIEDVDLTTATRDELAELERAVHPLTRKLAVRLARRRRRGREGRLDVRKTLRHALSTGGVPVDPRFRTPRPGKPEIVLLCDISGSVSTFARFTMQVVFAIGQQLSRVRSFAFIDGIDEVTEFFGPGADFGEAIGRIGRDAKVVWLDGHSDYGNAFELFVDRWGDQLGPKTTVIVTGDARTNYHDPNVEALRRIAEASRALFWLNPEQHRYWDTGDSVIGTYAPVCDGVFEVRNLRQLEGFVERVAVPRSRPVRRIA
ncbi:MAG: VWA domain-containing protein [Acidimicrobiia bacterium]|nr:VWA domain-containing protein [Acidimicrobiia bacterium]